MSFSIAVIGSPEAIKRKLIATSENLSGQSKVEFDAVLPALNTILDQQVNNGAIRLDAYGHANFDGEKKTFGNCGVTVAPLGALLAE